MMKLSHVKINVVYIFVSNFIRVEYKVIQKAFWACKPVTETKKKKKVGDPLSVVNCTFSDLLISM